jgi:hypothetical protein
MQNRCFIQSMHTYWRNKLSSSRYYATVALEFWNHVWNNDINRHSTERWRINLPDWRWLLRIPYFHLKISLISYYFILNSNLHPPSWFHWFFYNSRSSHGFEIKYYGYNILAYITSEQFLKRWKDHYLFPYLRTIKEPICSWSRIR